MGNAEPYTGEIKTEPVPGPACVTPCTLQIKRNESLVVTFSKPGYEPQTVQLGRAVSTEGGTRVAGNLIVGGVTGLVVDTAMGAGYDHQPNPLKVTLRPIQSRIQPAPAKRRSGR